MEGFFKILASIKDGDPQQADSFDLNYSLVGLEAGSVKLDFREREGTDLRERYFEFADYISENRTEQLPYRVKKEISGFMRQLKNHDTNLAVQLFNSSGVPVSMNPDQFVLKSAKYQNTEVLYGELTDVGGSNQPNVHIMTKNGSLTCDVTKEQAIELASRLYTVVGLACEITREFNEEKPIKIVVSEILPYDESKWEKNIARLRELFSERFKNTDPEEHFRALRSG